MRNWIERRYLEVVASIYIYNEHRGYTALDRVIGAVRRRDPGNKTLLAMIEQHRADERKHYWMFRRWFEKRGIMPLMVDRTCGHIDRFVEIMFRRRIDDLDTTKVIGNDELFGRLCRVISLTEQRGMKQVDILLKHPLVKHDKTLIRIFRIIEKDEPSHWAPYDNWLRTHGVRDPKWWEKAVDTFIHSELIVLKLPFLFFNPFIRRRTDWADANDPAERLASPIQAAA